MKSWLGLASAVALWGLSLTFATSARAEVLLEKNKDRAGADYRTFDIDRDSPEQCAAACLVDDKCIAFSFAAPGIVVPAGRCYLKNNAPQSTAKNKYTSGLKPKTQLEPNKDRVGGDYRTFDIPTDSPEQCAVACMMEDKCLAYTFTAPGVLVPAGRCHLKSIAPKAAPKAKYTSGVRIQ